MKKRILSLLMTCVMILTLLPTAALAADTSGPCGANAAWSFDAATGTLTISGTGATVDCAVYGRPWEAYKNQIKTVVVEEGITTIGRDAFYGYTDLTCVTFPASMEKIDSNSFSRCTSLTSVTIPENPDKETIIGSIAFYGCTSLTNITIPASVTKIDDYTFNGCTSLTSMTIPDSVTSIGSSSFNGCTGLTSVIIPDSVTTIGNSAFRNCTTLPSVTIPDSVTSIDNYAFRDCTALTSVTIPDSVTSIGNHAFSDCTDLTTVTILGSETSIGSNAFNGCAGLTSVNIPEGNDSAESAFAGIVDEDKVNTFNHSVVFDLNGHGDSTPDPQLIITNAEPKAVKPADPTAEGYTFGGWYTEEACTTPWDFDSTVTENVTLYAKWTETPAAPAVSYPKVYFITPEQTTGGTVRTSPLAASAGSTATVTVQPNAGWQLQSITVTAQDGTRIPVTGRDGKYTFEVPAAKVTVQAAFQKFYTDVPADAYYYDALLWAAQVGVTQDVTGELFDPEGGCTRAAMVAFLWRSAGSPEPVSADCPFEDVAPDAWYAKAVCWALETGITQGTSATTFSPDAICSRAQMVTFLHRVKGDAASSGELFADVEPDAWYADAVRWAVEQAITVGTSDTTFSPDETCSRAQAITFLYRSQN